jgi:phosphate transport system protein
MNIEKHISKEYDNELETIRSHVMEMGGIVENQLTDAITALVNSDLEVAETTVKGEYKVNRQEVAIDEKCIRILAKRQPAAVDLRLIMAVIKTITDLERIGDEAQKIAKKAISLSESQGPKFYYISIKAMGTLVTGMLHDALDAFARMDSKAAFAVASREPESDEQYVAILRQLMTYMMEDPRNITTSLDAVWIARAMERIADHARNICEYVIYFVEGKDVRHITLEEMEKELSE